MGSEPLHIPDDAPTDAGSSLAPLGTLPGTLAANLLPTSSEPPTRTHSTPHHGTETPPPSSLSVPRPFGRYRLLKVLGHGGMGTVYLAEDSQLGRQVALKVPRLERDGGTGELVQRFYREARIAATFHHPNLCPVYDVGQVDGVHYLTMPLCQGELLSDWLQRDGRLPPRTAVRLACQLTRALAVAHQAGVVHRDLKPVNIMVNERREPVVLDFGLSRNLIADPRLTNDGAMLGTPLYAPPEQLGGDPAELGPACDIYSLGVTLYEMLTGTVPFRGEAHVVFRQILLQEPQPPSQHRSDLDPRLDAICRKALAKDPRQRFHSMEEFAAALEDYLRNEGKPTRRVPPRRSPAPSKPARRRLLFALVAVVIASAGVLLTLAFTNRRVADNQPPAGDPFQAGTRWIGDYRFLPPMKGGGDAVLRIRERDGPRFQGEYETEKGKFAWSVSGEVNGPAIRWKLVKVIREAFPTGAAGNAIVKGSYDGQRLEATYKDSNSTAKLRLRLEDSGD
jgi:hypothetical protein